MAKNKKTKKSSKSRNSDTSTSQSRVMADQDPTSDLSFLNSMHCPKCGKMLSGPGTVRLQPRRKLCRKMQKLLHRNQNKSNLTQRQQVLVHRSMKQTNSVILRCGHCQWKWEQTLQTRTAFRGQKMRLKQVLQEQDAATVTITNKKTKQKMKKKERKKKTAAAKALELRAFQTGGISPALSAGNSTTGSVPKSSPSQSETGILSPTTTQHATGLSSSTSPSENLSENLTVNQESKHSVQTGVGHRTLHRGVRTSDLSQTARSLDEPSTPTFSSDVKFSSNVQKSRTDASARSTPTHGVQSGKITKKKMQKLQDIFKQQKQQGPPQKMSDSLSQFLNSLK